MLRIRTDRRRLPPRQSLSPSCLHLTFEHHLNIHSLSGQHCEATVCAAEGPKAVLLRAINVVVVDHHCACTQQSLSTMQLTKFFTFTVALLLVHLVVAAPAAVSDTDVDPESAAGGGGPGGCRTY